MKRLALLLVAGCGHTTLPNAVTAVEKGVKAVDVAADIGAAAWEGGVAARVESCRAEGHETKEARAKCLGIFDKAPEVAAKFRQVAAVYDQLAHALEDLESLAEDLQPYLDAARRERAK